MTDAEIGRCAKNRAAVPRQPAVHWDLIGSIMALWHDKRGRFSPLRAGTLVVLALPLAIVTYYAFTSSSVRGPSTRPSMRSARGRSASYFLALFITRSGGLRAMRRWSHVRRLIGVAAFLYLCCISRSISPTRRSTCRRSRPRSCCAIPDVGVHRMGGNGDVAATSNDTMVRRLGGIAGATFTGGSTPSPSSG